jgi:hypothetical protein
MKDYLISMFVDNELNLDEKIEFVETVHKNKPFKDETVELLDQEKLLQAGMVNAMPEVRAPVYRTEKTGLFRLLFTPIAGFATAMTLVAAFFLLRPAPVISPGELQHRFVIYNPDVSKTEIVGDFTRWNPVPLEKIGSSGYWSVTLKLEAGEYRYSYLIDNNRQIADPTVLTHEQDDFGGKNSIIKVTTAI